MPVSTVNISFQKDFLVQIDKTADNEARTRSELIREAVRIYIDRKKEWKAMLQLGTKIGATLEIAEADVMGEIKKHRTAKQKAR